MDSKIDLSDTGAERDKGVANAVNVGAGLLANAVDQSVHLKLTLRIREQARSHTFEIVPTLCVGTPLLTLRVTLLDAERP